MGSGPPPKEGEVVVSSSEMQEWRKALLHGDVKQQWYAAQEIKAKLEAAGY